MNRADELDTIAAQWIVRREKGGWNATDQIEFDSWLAEAPGNRIAYLRLTDVWNRAGRLKALDQPARRRFFGFRRSDVLKPLARVAALFIFPSPAARLRGARCVLRRGGGRVRARPSRVARHRHRHGRSPCALRRILSAAAAAGAAIAAA